MQSILSTQVVCGRVRLGRMANIHLPVVPMEHHYLITEEIEQIANLPEGRRLPHCIDFEANIYLRQENTGMLLGTYEPRSTPWSLDGTPQTFGHDLLSQIWIVLPIDWS